MRLERSSNRYQTFLQMLCVLLCLPILLYDVVSHMILEYELHHMRLLLFLCTLVQAAVICRIPWEKKDITGHLAVWYVIWMGITRVLVGYVDDNVVLGEILCAAQMCLVFFAGVLLERRQQECLISCVTAILTCVLLVWAFWAFRVLMTDLEMFRLMERRYVFLIEEPQENGILRTIQFFDIHRNESSALYMCGTWMLANRFFACRKKLWRIPMVLAAAVFFVMISILHSRTVQAITAIGYGMLVMIILMDRMHSTKRLPKIAVVCLAALLCVGVSYKGMSACDHVVGKFAEPFMPKREQTAVRQDVEPTQPEIQLVLLSHTVAPAEEATLAAPQQAPLQAEKLSDGAEMSDQRNFWKDLRTLTMRTEIWNSVFETVKNQKRIVAIGQPETQISKNLMEIGGLTRRVTHTHNGLLQILMVAGMPAVLLMGAILAILVIRMVKFFFSGAPIAEKIWMIPLGCLLIDSFMEPIFTRKSEFSSVFFFWILGIFTCCYQKYNQKA